MNKIANKMVNILMYAGILIVASMIFIAGYTTGAKNPVKFNENDKMNEETYAAIMCVNEITKAYNSGDMNKVEYLYFLQETLSKYKYRNALSDKKMIKSSIENFVLDVRDETRDMHQIFRDLYESIKEEDSNLKIYKPSGRLMGDKYYYIGDVDGWIKSME
jgi:hypothetical protein